MSVGAIGSSSSNSALWGLLQESVQGKAASETAAKSQASPAPQRMSGASPSAKGNMVDLKA